MRRNVLAIGLITLLIGVTIISISSIRVPDPLHSTSTMFKGIIDNKSRTILVLNDVQKGKNISLSIIPYNSFDLINIKIINPKGTLMFDQNSSQEFFSTLAPTISGNYSAVLFNLNNQDIYTNSMFGNSILFDSNKHPKFEIYTIFSGVIIFLIGIAICIIWITLKFFEMLRTKTRYKQLS
ncbi:MAG: hypothetical protein E6L03_04375 [Thaumarchaeota archaeon]|nr:MAG: hypothetical protein E6L03_04375 [Nitrososphaerota archaeon]